MSVDARDFIEGGVISNCCGASVMHGDMCQECGEHCEAENENGEEIYPLIEFLSNAHNELKRCFTIPRFFEWRYDLLNKYYPHEIFSVDQCNPNFFKESLDFICGDVEMPERKADKPYQNNYIDWLKEHKANIDKLEKK